MNVNLGIGCLLYLRTKYRKKYMYYCNPKMGCLASDLIQLKGWEILILLTQGKTVTAEIGGSFFDSAQSFAMIRGGHIDLAILGGMEVSEQGDLANWMIPGKLVKGMGDAMDLVHGAKRIVVIMEHANKYNESKIKKSCSLPLTGQKVVNRLITDLAVFDFTSKGMILVETQEGVSLDEVIEKTEASITISANLKCGKGDRQKASITR